MLPSLSPIIIPPVVCNTCGQQMRVVVNKIASGQVSGVTAYCDSENCRYAWDISTQYATGMPGKYVAPPPAPAPVVFTPPVGPIKKFPSEPVDAVSTATIPVPPATKPVETGGQTIALNGKVEP